MERHDDRNALRVIRTLSEAEELREFWTSRGTNRDGDLDFYLSVVCARREVVRPHVIVLFGDGIPKTMLIGRLEEKGIPIRIGYVGSRAFHLRTLTFIDGGILRDVSATDSELFIQSILGSLRADEADVAVLDSVNISHPLYELALSLPGFLCSDRVPTPSVHRVRKSSGGNDSFPASLSANERSNQRRRARRLLENYHGKVRIDCFHDGSEIGRLMQDAEAVARTSYQRALGVGFFNDQKMYQRLQVEAGKGTLRGHILYVDDRPCSFWIASLYGGVLYNDFMGYDPAYAHHAPGMYLVIRVIEEVFRDALVGSTPAIDFGGGDAEWKARLGNDHWHEASAYIWAPTLKGIAANALRMLVITAEYSAKAILRDTNLLYRIKRSWRKRLAQKSGTDSTS